MKTRISLSLNWALQIKLISPIFLHWSLSFPFISPEVTTLLSLKRVHSELYKNTFHTCIENTHCYFGFCFSWHQAICIILQLAFLSYNVFFNYVGKLVAY